MARKLLVAGLEKLIKCVCDVSCEGTTLQFLKHILGSEECVPRTQTTCIWYIVSVNGFRLPVECLQLLEESRQHFGAKVDSLHGLTMAILCGQRILDRQVSNRNRSSWSPLYSRLACCTASTPTLMYVHYT